MIIKSFINKYICIWVAILLDHPVVHVPVIKEVLFGRYIL